LLAGEEVSSGAFGGIFVVLDTAAGLSEMSELTAGDSRKFKEVVLRSHATTEIVK
jgi:hypothetical protein